MIVDSFKGIVNTVPIRSIPENSLSDAIDIDIDDSGSLIERNGYVQSLAVTIQESYGTLEGIAFIVSGDTLYQLDADLSLIQLSATTATNFCDFGDNLFTNDGLRIEKGEVTDLTAIAPIHSNNGKTIKVGSIVYTVPNEDTPANVFYAADGTQIESEYIGADGFPDNTDQIEFFRSSLWCSVIQDNYTVIFYSKPFLYNVFDYEVNNIVIPSKVLAMKRANEGLVIGTATAIYLYTDVLTQLADYGVIPGKSMVELPNGNVLIHTNRGVCTVPFQNITEPKVYLPMGTQCSTAIVYQNGIQKYIALHDDSVAFNQA